VGTPLGETEVMAFGQQAGPPASVRDVKELLRLLQDLGHSDFRDARGPMGLTQRQAGGRFTRDEVAALVERLQEAKADGTATADVGPAAAAPRDENVLRSMSAARLAGELERRGWTVTAPEA
jgi:hypothetical protein